MFDLKFLVMRPFENLIRGYSDFTAIMLFVAGTSESVITSVYFAHSVTLYRRRIAKVEMGLITIIFFFFIKGLKWNPHIDVYEAKRIRWNSLTTSTPMTDIKKCLK